MEAMKAITLWQPWASLCVEPRPCVCWAGDDSHINSGPLVNCRICSNTGERGPWKTIETRSWPAPKALIGQRIAIHAAKTSKPWSDLDAPALMSERGTIDAVLRAFGVMSDDGRSWPSPWVTDEAIHLGEVVLPLGAIVGSVVLADCVQMANPRWTDPVRPYLWVNEDETDAPHDLVLYRDGVRGENVSDQAPFGWFESGRWAWMFTDAEKFDEPVPARGRQGVWRWAA